MLTKTGTVIACGLTSAAAREGLTVHGRNEIRREVAKSRLALLAAQFVNPLVGLLLAACVVSALLGESANAIAIGVIVVINAAIGYFQEARAERALLALRAMTAPRARVLRDGHQAVIPAAEVVPDDVLLLEAGDVVAADAVVTEAHALKTNEAALTGESLPTGKKVGASEPGAPLAERFDRVFMGTAVSTGTGVARVSATGMATELGKIAHMLEGATDTQTPLQERLARVGRMLLFLCLGVVAIVVGLGFLQGRPLFEVFMAAISLAVAVVPEGLPAVVTIALAIGVQRMAARNVLIRKLPAVETLGSATVICTDKTGTLTTGVMAVRETWGHDHAAVVATAAACCDAELDAGGRGGTGDPTEVAILAAALERGIRREQIEAERPRRAVEPFDPETRRMSVLRADGLLYVKGAFESIAPLCREGTDGAAQASVEMAERGLRVLAVGLGEGPETKDLRLLGLLGIADPPRTEAMDAIAAARAAGIRTVMITGDHPKTAGAIAREMGIAGPNDDLADVVHARATPADKLRIVRDWKARGAVVAMTGDGVNDAPALREAHIGIAMGRTGTEVTREASDMVLADDNFASIVAAIREGRGIFDNIRKALLYLLTGNTGELLVMLGAAFAGLPLPLLPLHLLWINLVTDGLPALALVMDPVVGDAMQKPPRPPSQPILGRPEWTQILLTGLLQGAVTLGAFVWTLRTRDLVAARDFAFTTLVFGQIFQSFAFRSRTRLLWEIGPFGNLRLVTVVAVSVLVQIVIHYIPLLDRLFGITPLGAYEVAISLLLGLVPVTAIELSKLVRRRLRAPVNVPVRAPRQEQRGRAALRNQRQLVVVLTRFGGAEGFELVEPPMPTAGPGEVRVRVLAANVQFTDVILRKGKYPDLKQKPPLVLGYDVVGEIDEIGSGVSSLAVGDRVADLTMTGSYARYRTLRADRLVRVPAGVDEAEAAALVLSWSTAYQLLHREARVAAGQRVLIHGAAGAVGQALVALGKLAGLQMWGTARAEHADLVRASGATPVDYQSDDVRELVPEGFDGVFDGIGERGFAQSWASVKKGGMLSAYGFSSAVKGGVRLTTMGWWLLRLHLWNWSPNGKRARFYSIGALRKRHPDWYRADLEKLLGLLSAKAIRPRIAERIGLDGVADAHRRIEAGGVTGKIVICP